MSFCAVGWPRRPPSDGRCCSLAVVRCQLLSSVVGCCADFLLTSRVAMHEWSALARGAQRGDHLSWLGPVGSRAIRGVLLVIISDQPSVEFGRDRGQGCDVGLSPLGDLPVSPREGTLGSAYANVGVDGLLPDIGPADRAGAYEPGMRASERLPLCLRDRRPPAGTSSKPGWCGRRPSPGTAPFSCTRTARRSRTRGRRCPRRARSTTPVSKPRRSYSSPRATTWRRGRHRTAAARFFGRNQHDHLQHAGNVEVRVTPLSKNPVTSLSALGR